MKKIGKGKALEELVKGSMDYTMQVIREAFRRQFGDPIDVHYYLAEIFADHVVVSGWSETWPLKADEYYQVSYTRTGETYVFASRDQWEVVELTYQPKTTLAEAKGQKAEGGKRKSRRLEESVIQSVELLETDGSDNPNGPWKIKGIGITADVVNANGRRYPAPVLEAAVRKLKGHLHESAGQGRLLQPASLTVGEADHPKDKANRRPLLLETVINWESVDFDGRQVLLEGKLLGTSKGMDIRAIMKGGVKPGISQRAYGESKTVNEGGQKIEEITNLEITGYDLTAQNEESDPFAEVTFHESINSQQGDEVMNLEELIKYITDHPEVFQGVTEAQIRKMGAEQLTALEEKIRTSLGIGAEANLAESMKSMAEKAHKFEESQAKAAVDQALAEVTKDLPFGDKLNKQFTEAMKASGAKTAEDVKVIAEAKRKEYGAIAAELKLGSMGYGFKGQLKTLGTVLENENGTPEFARGAFELAESIRRVDDIPTRNWNSLKTVNEAFAKKVLDRFDVVYKRELMLEARMLEEAGQVSDLNLPYSVARAVAEEAMPDLIASGIFDVDVIETNPTRLYYRRFSGETGYAPSVTDEDVVADHGVWVSLAHNRLTPGTVVVTNAAGSTTYDEDVDYLIDYANGRLYALAAGDITDAQALKVDYDYTAIRKGELQAIERGKTVQEYKTVEAQADRLADQISREAIYFAQSQMGMDVRASTLSDLAKQMRRKIDQGMMYMGLSAAKTVASNVVGTWTAASDDELDLVKLVGKARVKVSKRFYEATFLLLSMTNADILANWTGFTAAGKRPDSDLNANGYIGRVKGLAVFQGTEFTDAYGLVGNKQLVMHRIYKPLSFAGPYPSYDENGKLIAADQYYAEELNLTETPVAEKGALIKFA